MIQYINLWELQTNRYIWEGHHPTTIWNEKGHNMAQRLSQIPWDWNKWSNQWCPFWNAHRSLSGIIVASVASMYLPFTQNTCETWEAPGTPLVCISRREKEWSHGNLAICERKTNSLFTIIPFIIKYRSLRSLRIITHIIHCKLESPTTQRKQGLLETQNID
jgi:hypothetical protein